MILIDTSAWIEFLRDTENPVCNKVERALDREPAVCEPVLMEIFSGARDDRHLGELRRLMARCTTLRTESIDYEVAASLYRQCRRNGKTPRRMLDCLIAAIAIRHQVALIQLDNDFLVIAENSPLKLA